MGVGQPLRAGVVQVGQGAFLEGLRCVLVAGHRAFGIAGHWFVHPLYPFRRVEPAVAQFNQPSGGLGNGDSVWIVGIVDGGNVRRQSVWKRERLEGGGRRVTRIVALPKPRTESERPCFVKPAV